MMSRNTQLPSSREDWCEEARFDFEERAAIVEFEAKRTRKDAERMAEEMTREQWAIKGPTP